SVIVIFALAGAAIRIPVLLMPSGLILDLYEAVCRFTMKLPFNTLITGRPGWGRIIVYYLLILTVIIPWKKTEKRDKMHLKAGKALLLAAALVIIFIPRSASAGVDMLNVGQGDLIVMKDAKGSTVIYDGGSSDVDLTGKYRLLPYLKYNGVRHIDAVFLSHPHLDHYSALVELFENCEKEGIDVGALYVSHEYRFYPDEYRAVFDAAAKGDIPIIETDMEKDLTFGDILVRPVYPYEHTDTGDVNDSSLVLLAQINGFSILLTGDVTSRSDNELIACLDKRGVKHIDCLKVCHHGSAEANSQRLINRLSPSCALISCGFSYGHPHREVLDRLSKAGVKYHITRDEGQIRIKTHDNGFVLCKYPYL
ncbi:MAG: MBL fold metallo-hydrolase, partial [Lachnospiraceae bacterium]|nr:MBL fold metallo-hydrolase [Lachnospiraceae bacterium]